MAITLKQTEVGPASYPRAPYGLSDAAAALNPALIWQRLESYVAHRWTARDVTWIVEGPGEWVPPLTPTTISTVEVWSAADAWETVTLSASPCGGYDLPATGPYRFTGTVGGGVVPPAVAEAYRRLAEYWAAAPSTAPGSTSERESLPDLGEIAIERSPTWVAKAISNSGAGDLLRSYRRAG